MRGVLKYQLDGLRTAWHGGLGGEARRSAIAFCLLAVIGFGVCMALPDLRTQLVGLAVNAVNSSSAIREDGTLSAVGIFLNNVEACAFTMVYGLLPFIQLPALALGLNAILLGVVAAWYVAEGYSILLYLAALLPHSIFELPALILAFAMGLYVCGQLTRRCRRQEGALHVWDCLVLISRMLLLVHIPLLAVAAVVETYLTPAVAALFT